MARFTAAEARLYPMAVSDPEGYELATTVVGIVVADLRDSCPDLDSVLDRRAELVRRLPELVEASGSTLGGLAPDIVVDAASALRCREVRPRRDE